MGVLLLNKQVTIKEGKLCVSNFETEENDIVSYFSEVSPELLEERFQTSLKVGVVALKTLGTTEKIDYIEKEFQKLEQKFGETLNETASELKEHLENIFGESGSFFKVIDETFGENGKLLKQVFDPTKEDTPLSKLRCIFEEKLEKLRTDMGIKEAVKEIEAVTPRKGYEFEDLCEELLSHIVKKHVGDELTNTTTIDGRLSGSKKGDFVITLGERPDCKIVLETKDRDKLTLPEIHQTMQESIENRDAKYGIFVTKWVESLPKSVGCFNEYQGNHLVCALTSKKHEGIIHEEVLHIAVCWARIRSLLEVAEAEGLDISAIQSELGEASKKLDLFKRIKAECTNIEANVKNIRSLSDEIREAINKSISVIQNEIIKVMETEEAETSKVVTVD